MRGGEKIRLALERFMARLQRFGEAAFPEEHRDGLAPITMEDRPIIIKFMREVYHEAKDEKDQYTRERIFAAKHPEEYRRIVAIAGTVPRKSEG